MTKANVQTPVLETNLVSLKKLYSGKVRDIYEVDDDHLLIIASDRISAYDVILPSAIPGKGRLLTQMALFWFDRMGDLVPNHLTGLSPEDVLDNSADIALATGRSMVVKRLKGLPVEAVVRGYLVGSGWKDYQRDGAICGVDLPDGLQLASQLPQVIFTPATKAAAGDHDENITFEIMEKTIGSDLAARIRDISLSIYQRASDYALERNIIIADTKFEFGIDATGELTLMDEILTPDSSRFWDVKTLQEGVNPDSYDKQYIRDYLETLDWDKTAPGPELPASIVAGTVQKYEEALTQLSS